MKFFGQRDELFEVMAQAAARNRGGRAPAPASPGPAPAPSPTPSPTPSLTVVTGTGTVVTGAGTVGTGAAEGATSGAGAPEPGSGTRSRLVVPSSSQGRLSATTSTALARAGISTNTLRGALTPLGGSPLGKGELVEIEGDALVVIDDEAEVAPQPPTASDGMRLFALRGDTMVVGGVLVAGLLFGSFLLGRTTAGPEGEEGKAVEVATLPPDVEARPAEPAPGGTGSVPASVPREQAPTPAQAAPAPAQQAAAAAPPARSAQGTQAIQVCHTSPEKAQGLAKGLNEDPRSPIFGRGDLEASAKGGSVRISGFARQEAEVMARVQATSDPTGGSGAFRDAYWVAVR